MRTLHQQLFQTIQLVMIPIQNGHGSNPRVDGRWRVFDHVFLCSFGEDFGKVTGSCFESCLSRGFFTEKSAASSCLGRKCCFFLDAWDAQTLHASTETSHFGGRQVQCLVTMEAMVGLGDIEVGWTDEVFEVLNDEVFHFQAFLTVGWGFWVSKRIYGI